MGKRYSLDDFVNPERQSEGIKRSMEILFIMLAMEKDLFVEFGTKLKLACSFSLSLIP